MGIERNWVKTKKKQIFVNFPELTGMRLYHFASLRDVSTKAVSRADAISLAVEIAFRMKIQKKKKKTCSDQTRARPVYTDRNYTHTHTQMRSRVLRAQNRTACACGSCTKNQANSIRMEK